MPLPFPDRPAITLYDPLAELLGAGDGRLTYHFTDAVKLAGHACPTVAGAFVLTLRALRALHGDGTPERGAIRVTIPGPVDADVNGPMSQVITLITGAAGDNGFQGLGGRFARRGLMTFDQSAPGFVFQCMDTGAAVVARYDPAPIPTPEGLQALMREVLAPNPAPTIKERFAEAWRTRVLAILDDAGDRTVHLERYTG